MNKTLLMLIIAVTMALPANAITAREAFVRLASPSLNLLTLDMRQDLLSYYDADTLRQVPNALAGLSQLTRPVTDSYLKVRITPVSTMTIKILPHKNDTIVATVYTIASPGQAADSQVSFYDSKMNKLSDDKYLKMAQIDEFIETPHNRQGRELKKELLSAIPYPTVEYTLTPESDDLTARLTVTDYLGAETMQQLKPYLRPELVYIWKNDRKFELRK